MNFPILLASRGDVRCTVDKSVPADDVTVSFGALLRQMFKGSKEASFDRVRNTLSKVATIAGAGGRKPRARENGRGLTKPYSRKHLRALMQEISASAGLVPADDRDGGHWVGSAVDLSPKSSSRCSCMATCFIWGMGRELLKANGAQLSAKRPRSSTGTARANDRALLTAGAFRTS